MSSPHLTWVAGGSGLVGRELLRQLAPHPTLVLLRRAVPDLPVLAGQVQRVVNLTALPADGSANLPPPDRVFIALGTTIAQAGSQAAFRAVDFDAVLAVAQAARRAGATRCAVVSALGADAQSRVFYNRVKGEMERALSDLGFERLVIARPSLLDGHREALGQPARPGEAWSLRLARPLAPLIPQAWRPIAAERVARAMRLALDQPGPAVEVLESGAMQTRGAP
ncbi:NAD(P)H-binding protein [Roseateles sp. BYS87W]|uniref:NAD(P)H-binding protein n=1 Tax=Pelomonas baiyunensis TaxID=3299026 RepID=A0ABW7GWZ8_9BURK